MLALDEIGDIFASESSADTEIYIVKSRSVIGKTVDDLNLTVNVKPKYFPFIGSFFAKNTEKSELTNTAYGFEGVMGNEELVVSEFNIPERFISKEFVIVVEADQNYSLWFEDIKLLDGVTGSSSSNTKYNVGIKVDHIAADKGARFRLVKSSRLSTVLKLQKRVKVVGLGKDTGIMELSLLGTNKARISAILNTISDNYVEQNVQRLGAEAENSLKFIKDQLPKIKASLNQAESALNAYREVRESVDLSLETQSLLESLVKVEADISSMALNEADVSRRFTKEHPNYISFKSQQSNLLLQRDKL
ncbi:MAG: hypothetical protein QMC38_12280, partial [Sinobacterium sp.]